MSVAWRALRPSIETKLTSSLPPLQLQDSSDHTAHVTKRAFALPSRAVCRFAEDRRRSPNRTTAQPPPSQGVTNGGSSWYILCRLQRGGHPIQRVLTFTHFSIFLFSANSAVPLVSLHPKPSLHFYRAGSPSILFNMKFLYMITLVAGATAIAIEPRHHQGKGKGGKGKG